METTKMKHQTQATCLGPSAQVLHSVSEFQASSSKKERIHTDSHAKKMVDKNLSVVLEENQLLHETILARDREIQQMRIYMDQYIVKAETQTLQERYFCLNQAKQTMGTAVASLNQQLDEIRVKYEKSCEKISQLQSKLRQTMSKAHLKQEELK